MKIEILGPGCARCRKTEAIVRDALSELNVEAEVEHIYDPVEYARRGVLFTPAVMIEGAIMVSGKIPTIEQVKSWIQEGRAN